MYTESELSNLCLYYVSRVSLKKPVTLYLSDTVSLLYLIYLFIILNYIMYLIYLK